MDGLHPIDETRKRGFVDIPEDILLGAWPGPVIYQTIEPSLCGGYVAVPDGIPAYSFLVRSGGPGSNLLDTVAITEAGDVYVMRGLAWCAGADNYDRADIKREPLLLHSSPLDWVASGGKGAVVLDWMTAAPKLATLTCIVCDRESLAPKVDRMVSRYRPRPKLRVLSWGE